MRRELREVSLTTNLAIQVAVAGGVVVVTGAVPSFGDIDNLEAVAARVFGVIDVVENFRTPGNVVRRLRNDAREHRDLVSRGRSPVSSLPR